MHSYLYQWLDLWTRFSFLFSFKHFQSVRRTLENLPERRKLQSLTSVVWSSGGNPYYSALVGRSFSVPDSNGMFIYTVEFTALRIYQASPWSILCVVHVSLCVQVLLIKDLMDDPMHMHMIIDWLGCINIRSYTEERDHVTFIITHC